MLVDKSDMVYCLDHKDRINRIKDRLFSIFIDSLISLTSDFKFFMICFG
ncbi:hypothetical protein [Peptoniphilus porci]|nr:hypothetical protein [Peptoniphilus porci]